jgi:Tfp pilus assembly protein PilF
MLERFPRDADSLVNYGLLAAQLGHPEEALEAWETSVDVDPNQANAHLYLAQAFDQRGEFAAAARNWNSYLQLTPEQPTEAPAEQPAAGGSHDPTPRSQQVITATIQLADDQARTHQEAAALNNYNSAVSKARVLGDLKLESLALARLADLQDELGNPAAAAQSYQHGLALDAQSGDRHGEGSDWFNYGQFLRRHNQPDEIVYACFLQSESLLAADGGELQTVQAAAREIASKLGKRAATVQKDLPTLLARATKITAA